MDVTKDRAQRRADAWNKKHAGKPAGELDADGYHYVTIDYEGEPRRMRVDRVIWAMQTGAYPLGDIVHINGDNADSRWDNLRDSGQPLQ